MERTSVSFTILLLAHASAHAAHPSSPRPTAAPTDSPRHTPSALRPLASDASARVGDFVAYAPAPSGLVLARQLIAPRPSPSPSPNASAAKQPSPRSKSRVVYMNRAGTVLWPGDNDASLNLSSIVQEPVVITSWDIDDEMWADTMACMTAMYARWDLRITDQDPGEVPHIEAVFGGHPNDVGLPDNVAGVSPFTSDCSNIDNSVVFTFTDVLPDNAQLMCEVMAQEIAHSFGLDHEMLAQDPMSYLDYEANRTFQDVTAACGEYEDRPCGIAGNTCRDTQNSVALLDERVGRVTGEPGSPTPGDPDDRDDNGTRDAIDGGCSAGGAADLGAPAGGALLVLLALVNRRNRRATTRAPRHRA